MLERYFDNAATTPIDPRVLEAMLPYLRDGFGNANSLHDWGRRAHDAVERAREQVASAIGAEDPRQILFTSGATEGNNWVLSSFGHGAVSPFEHSSVWETAKYLGFSMLKNEGLRLRPPATKLPFISVMAVNNELGARFEPAAMRPHAQVLHSDITQAAAKYPVPLEHIDYATFSAHKFYGPKGVGALYMGGEPLPPMLHGGEHEHGLRAGTLNVAGIVGMGQAAMLARSERNPNSKHVARLRQMMMAQLDGLSDFQVNGGDNPIEHILSLSFLGVEGETLVIEVDAAGYGISSGAACSSRATEPSHVLTALGLAPEWLRGSVRISFGRFNTPEAACGLGLALRKAVNGLRNLS